MNDSPITQLAESDLPIVTFTVEPTRSARLKRDDNGLIVDHPYKFTPEGRVDYRAMLDPRHLFVVDEKADRVVKAQGKPIGECDLTQVNPKWLRVRKGGWRQLLNLRGYRSVCYHSLSVGPDKAAVVCEIELTPNYETDGYPVIASGVASASTRSMDRQMLPYMEAFAENRSFARAVQLALSIDIMSEDEIDAEAVGGVKGEDDAVSEATTGDKKTANGYTHLRDLCTSRAHPITFAALKARAIKHNAELTPEQAKERILSDPSTWTDWASVQDIDAWLLMGKIQEADAAGKKGKA